MAELGPGDPDARPIDLDVRAVALGEEVGHAVAEQLGGQPFASRDPLVELALEPGERRHDEEVAAEVRHRLLEHGELQRRIGDGLEHVGAEHRLVEVRRDLGHEHRVVGVDLRLRLPA